MQVGLFPFFPDFTHMRFRTKTRTSIVV